MFCLLANDFLLNSSVHVVPLVQFRKHLYFKYIYSQVSESIHYFFAALPRAVLGHDVDLTWWTPWLTCNYLCLPSCSFAPSQNIHLKANCLIIIWSLCGRDLCKLKRHQFSLITLFHPWAFRNYYLFIFPPVFNRDKSHWDKNLFMSRGVPAKTCSSSSSSFRTDRRDNTL